MNKTELVYAMAEEAGLSKADADKALKAFISTVQSEVKAGNTVFLRGFGTFYGSKRKATKSFGTKIPAMVLPRFKAGSVFKRFVNTKTTKKK